MSGDRFVLNRNEGQDVLHKNPTEVCNTDDSKDRHTIDAATAEALLSHSNVRRCAHCNKEEEPS